VYEEWQHGRQGKVTPILLVTRDQDTYDVSQQLQPRCRIGRALVLEEHIGQCLATRFEPHAEEEIRVVLPKLLIHKRGWDRLRWFAAE
jgi:hypothetical protein